MENSWRNYIPTNTKKTLTNKCLKSFLKTPDKPVYILINGKPFILECIGEDVDGVYLIAGSALEE